MLAVLILILLTHLLILFVLFVGVGSLNTIAQALSHMAHTFSVPVDASSAEAEREER